MNRKREHGCDWDSYTCKAAAESGHLHILQWARQHGCDWVSSTCKVAAAGGHFHVLQWAREQGCNWNSKTCSAAARLNLQVKNMRLSKRASLLSCRRSLAYRAVGYSIRMQHGQR